MTKRDIEKLRKAHKVTIDRQRKEIRAKKQKAARKASKKEEAGQ